MLPGPTRLNVRPDPRSVREPDAEEHQLGDEIACVVATFISEIEQDLPLKTPSSAASRSAELPEDPKADIPPEQILTVLRSVLAMFFPLLTPAPAN